MTGVSLPEWTRWLVEKEESIDELWHGKKLLPAASAAYLNSKDRGDPCGRFYPGFKEARMPASVSSRVLRHQRGGGMCLTRG